MILDEINSLKEFHNGFNKSNQRWSACYMNYSDGEKHVSCADFEKMSDEELLNAYKMILKRHFRQM
jgi:hypothetical protein